MRRRRQGRFVIVGTLIGTAIIASSLALGTTVRASLRHVAVTELGPVDELVISRPEAGGAVRDAVSAANLDLAGTLPLVALPTTVVTKAFVARVAPVQILETDFAHAASFGPATGITGPTPGAGEVVVSEALARQVSLSPGDRMSVYAGTTVFTVRVVRILPTIGVVGLPRLGGDDATTALDVFVSPGTIESLPAAAAALAVIPSTTGPSAAGGAVTGALRRAVAGIPATVVPIKAQVLAAAAEGARRFDRFLEIFAGLGVMSGLLLVALAVTILVDERRRGAGDPRGARRSSPGYRRQHGDGNCCLRRDRCRPRLRRRRGGEPAARAIGTRTVRRWRRRAG